MERNNQTAAPGDPGAGGVSVMPVGRVKWFEAKRHFGFLIQDDGGEIFFHETDVSEIDRPLDAGDRVIFRLEEGPRGPIARRLFCVRRAHELDGSKLAG